MIYIWYLQWQEKVITQFTTKETAKTTVLSETLLFTRILLFFAEIYLINVTFFRKQLFIVQLSDDYRINYLSDLCHEILVLRERGIDPFSWTVDGPEDRFTRPVSTELAAKIEGAARQDEEARSGAGVEGDDGDPGSQLVAVVTNQPLSFVNRVRSNGLLLE